MTGRFDRTLSKTIKLVEMLRTNSDYADYRDATHEEADEAIQKASEFYKAVMVYISSYC